VSAVLPPLRGDELAFCGLGSNVGDRLDALQRAVDALDAAPRSRVEDASKVYETAPVGGPEQEAFLNMAVRVTTRLSPRRLLAACQRVEGQLGRQRTQRWGPRTIDVDILLYGHRRVATRALAVPHPRLLERAFALIPLMEVAPGMTLPDGTSLAAAAARLGPVEGVEWAGSQVSPSRGPGRETGRDTGRHTGRGAGPGSDEG
jgi:2-amino-4-hydroxy-6-hydroxymethyldihydropteridine diphosphokinase